jgi:hypothetical protein
VALESSLPLALTVGLAVYLGALALLGRLLNPPDVELVASMLRSRLPLRAGGWRGGRTP